MSYGTGPEASGFALGQVGYLDSIGKLPGRVAQRASTAVLGRSYLILDGRILSVGWGFTCFGLCWFPGYLSQGLLVLVAAAARPGVSPSRVAGFAPRHEPVP